MNSPKEWPRAAALVLVTLMAGCSTTKKEPVYTDIPAPSSQTATLQPAEAPPAETGEPTPADTVKTDETAKADESKNAQLIVTPDNILTGNVVSVNRVGRFVVLQFPPGRMPAEGSTLFVYRQGLKVAELNVTGPQKDDHTVADIRTGECRPDDEVRDR